MAFKLAKMLEIANARISGIVIRGLITTITLGLGLHADVATLEPIEDFPPLNLNSSLA